MGKLTLAYEDYGPEASVMSGDDEYEFYYELDEDSTHRFFARGLVWAGNRPGIIAHRRFWYGRWNDNLY